MHIKEPNMPTHASVVGKELHVPGEKPKKFDTHAAAVAALKKVKLEKGRSVQPSTGVSKKETGK
jgi:hypothetical protein